MLMWVCCCAAGLLALYEITVNWHFFLDLYETYTRKDQTQANLQALNYMKLLNTDEQKTIEQVCYRFTYIHLAIMWRSCLIKCCTSNACLQACKCCECWGFDSYPGSQADEHWCLLVHADLPESWGQTGMVHGSLWTNTVHVLTILYNHYFFWTT